MIKVGQIYGSDGVEIRIDSMSTKSICATVISVDEFWSSPSRIGLLVRRHDGSEVWGINFKVGMKLEFGPDGGKIEKPQEQGKPNRLPWFVLTPDKERFEHYR